MIQPRVSPWLHQNISIAPLAVFRIVFGLLMLGSTIRFWALGWIEDHYIRSTVQFKYYGFDWVQLLPPAGMYALHVGMILGALGIMLGYRYRLSALLFFLTFTYTELIDLTYYLNHYYFVSLISLLLIFLPANRYFSIDAWRNPDLRSLTAPRWTILVLQFQLAVVYIFAGLAKINYAWLIEAMPLRIWLPANDTLPLIGPLLKWQYAPWLFSWAGMLYDCTIVFWLSQARTRPLAYIAVIVFHAITGLMFQIGVFPVVMIGATLIFFPAGWHERVLNGIWKLIKNVLRGFNPSPIPSPPRRKGGLTSSKILIQEERRPLILGLIQSLSLFWKRIKPPSPLGEGLNPRSTFLINFQIPFSTRSCHPAGKKISVAPIMTTGNTPIWNISPVIAWNTITAI